MEELVITESRLRSAGGDKPRLGGVDLFRGLCAFGVVLVHSGLVVGNDRTAQAIWLQELFGRFIVPFFLAAALFFAAKSLPHGNSAVIGGGWLWKRGVRILVPYFAWTVVYSVAQMSKYLLTGEREKSLACLSDPIGRVLLGGSGMHLYFLPLLFIGFFTLQLSAAAVRRANWRWFLFAAVVTFFASEALAHSGNAFRLDTLRAFDRTVGGAFTSYASWGPIRLLLVVVAHMVRCAPYAIIALAGVRYVPAELRVEMRNKFAIVAGAVFLVGACGLVGIPEAILGFCALFLGVFISDVLPESVSTPLVRIGVMSFGIFLVHQLFLQIIQLLAAAHIPRPMNLKSLVIIASLSFAASWLTVAAVAKSRWRSVRECFGLT